MGFFLGALVIIVLFISELQLSSGMKSRSSKKLRMERALDQEDPDVLLARSLAQNPRLTPEEPQFVRRRLTRAQALYNSMIGSEIQAGIPQSESTHPRFQAPVDYQASHQDHSHQQQTSHSPRNPNTNFYQSQSPSSTSLLHPPETQGLHGAMFSNSPSRLNLHETYAEHNKNQGGVNSHHFEDPVSTFGIVNENRLNYADAASQAHLAETSHENLRAVEYLSQRRANQEDGSGSGSGSGSGYNK